MIAIDTSSLIAYLSGDEGEDVLLVDDALAEKQVVFPPVVLAEVLSDPLLSTQNVKVILGIPILEPTPGYWQRSGHTRAKLRSKGWKAKLADTLIAQSCIDAEVPLVTRDLDFRHFVRFVGLKLMQ